MLAVVMQVFLPGVLAVRQTTSTDVSHLICAPTGELSPEAQTAARRIAGLLDEQPSDRLPSDNHCSLCTLIQPAALPEPVAAASPAAFAKPFSFAYCETAPVPVAQGPPLGSRGPPTPL
jgi:hypothetical protein